MLLFMVYTYVYTCIIIYKYTIIHVGSIRMCLVYNACVCRWFPLSALKSAVMMALAEQHRFSVEAVHKVSALLFLTSITVLFYNVNVYDSSQIL